MCDRERVSRDLLVHVTAVCFLLAAAIPSKAQSVACPFLLDVKTQAKPQVNFCFLAQYMTRKMNATHTLAETTTAITIVVTSTPEPLDFSAISADQKDEKAYHKHGAIPSRNHETDREKIEKFPNFLFMKSDKIDFKRSPQRRPSHYRSISNDRI